jgi:hypothetical protein
LSFVGNRFGGVDLAVLFAPSSSAGSSLPHLSSTLDIDTYIQAVVDLHFHPEYGTPYWLDRSDDLDFDPRAEINSISDLTKFPPADEEALRDSPLRYITPQYYDITEIDISNSTGTTGQKKSMPYGRPVSDDMGEWYAYHVSQRSPIDGDWFAVGPYGLYEQHLVRAANACDQVCHFVGIKPKFLKKQGRVLQEMTDGLGGFLRSIPNLTAGLKGMARLDATISAAEDIVTTQSFQHMASGIGIPQQLHPILETKGPTDPADVETLLMSGGHVPEETRAELAQLYPNASIVPMYATSFTGACIDHWKTDHVAYYPMAPTAFLDVVDQDQQRVSTGERGRTAIHRVGADFFWPMQIERETARREPARDPFCWGGIAAIEPL